MSSADGRTVRLFLVDGMPTGLITAEIMNWSGHVLAGPRSRLGEILQRKETQRTGVYFLIGDDPEVPTKNRVYVGETDDFAARIRNHNKDESKDFWTRLCVVTSKDQNLTKAHVRYLERRLIGMARDAGRASLANGNDPGGSQLPESDEADMEYFLGQMQIVLPTLGFDFLRQRPRATPSAQTPDTPAAEKADGQVLLTMSGRRAGVEAQAIESDGEITVLQGSTAVVQGGHTLNQYGHIREQLIEEGRLRPSEDGKYLVFAEDVSFKSPSAASATILDRNDNGRRSWRVKATNQTLGEWQDAQAEGAGE